MDLGIRGRTAFVAASSQGLGKSVALALAAEGVNVIICGRNIESLQESQKEILAISDVDVQYYQVDLSVPADRAQMIEQVLNGNKIDILVTNSGGPPSGPFEEFEKSDWDAAYELLLASAIDIVKGFLPGMKAQKWGRIIAITSQAVKQPVGNLALSNSVRSSVAGLVKTLSNEYGKYNITVNSVLPGYTETKRLEHLIDVNPEFANAKSDIPLGRFGQPEEFAAAVAFLCSERASYITGVSLAVDGGWIKGI